MTRQHRFPARIVFLLLGIALVLTLPLSVSAAPSKRMLSGVPPTAQRWSLSCEYAATSAATAYFGNRVTQQMLRDEIGTDANPHKGFRGDITGAWGDTTDYGVYAEPIAAVLQAHGFHATVFYGDAERLRGEIAADHPVVVWIVGDYTSQERTTLNDDDGEYILVPHEHTVTVFGYDANGVWVIDPSDTSSTYVAWATFDRGWSQLDRMALAIAP